MDARFTIDELAAETGATPRQIRRWIERGVVPRALPRAEGYRPTYDRRYTLLHRERIRVAQQIIDRNMTLGDIADYLNPEWEEAE
jgi:DNA-binding transcriptional MerR regulator